MRESHGFLGATATIRSAKWAQLLRTDATWRAQATRPNSAAVPIVLTFTSLPIPRLLLNPNLRLRGRRWDVSRTMAILERWALNRKSWVGTRI